MCLRRNESLETLEPDAGFRKPIFRKHELTQLVEVSLRAVSLQDRAHHPGLQEGGPLVHQAALPPDVALRTRGNVEKTPPKPVDWALEPRRRPHRTDPGHHGVDVLRVPAVVRQPLAQEEVELAVVGVRAVGDQVGVDEYRL